MAQQAELPRPGIEPVPPALEVQSLSRWTTREVQEEDTETGISKPKCITSFIRFLQKSLPSLSRGPCTVPGCWGSSREHLRQKSLPLWSWDSKASHTSAFPAAKWILKDKKKTREHKKCSEVYRWQWINQTLTAAWITSAGHRSSRLSTGGTPWTLCAVFTSTLLIIKYAGSVITPALGEWGQRSCPNDDRQRGGRRCGRVLPGWRGGLGST